MTGRLHLGSFLGIVLGLTGNLLAQCQDCGPGYGAVGYGGPPGVNGRIPFGGPQGGGIGVNEDPSGYGYDGPDYDASNIPVGPSRCGHCRFHSEQEFVEYGCNDCQWNWGQMQSPHNALTPRFGPTVIGIVDYQFLVRDFIKHVDFATFGAAGSTVVSTREFNNELQAGARLTVGAKLIEGLNLEAEYFGLQEWDDLYGFRNTTTNSQGAAGNLFSPFSDFGRPAGVVGLDFNTLSQISYTSELNNFEINLRHRSGMMCGMIETSFLYGVRYMKIEDNFGYLTVSNVPTPTGTTNRVTTQTENDLIGAQVGGMGAWRISDRWWIEFDLKACLAQNDAFQNTIYTVTTGGATTTFPGARRRGSTAFIGDINLVTNYQLTSAVAVRVGYQAIWAEGIAIGHENFEENVSALRLGPTEIDDHGVVVYHGPHAGLILNW